MSAIARFVLRHPRKILGFWLVVLLLSLAGASRLSDRVQNGGYAASGSQSIRAAELEEHQFGRSSEPQAYLSVLAAHGSRTVSSGDVLETARALRGVAGVRLVGAPATSADGRAALMPVTFAGSYGYAQTRVPEVESALAHSSAGLLDGAADRSGRHLSALHGELQEEPFDLLADLVPGDARDSAHRVPLGGRGAAAAGSRGRVRGRDVRVSVSAHLRGAVERVRRGHRPHPRPRAQHRLLAVHGHARA